MWTLVCSFLSAQSSPTDKSSCFSQCWNIFWASADSLSIYQRELLLPSISFSLTPGSSRPLTSVATLWKDFEVWKLFAVLRSCWNPLWHCLLPCPLPVGKPWDQAAVGSQQPAQQRAGQARGRELQTDITKGRRPSGDHGDRDTHLNNSGSNKSFRLGSVLWNEAEFLCISDFHHCRTWCYLMTWHWKTNIILKVFHIKLMRKVAMDM